MFAEALFEGEAEEIIRATVEMAKARDIAAIRLCLDRVAPRPRDRAAPFDLAALHSAQSVLSALADIAAAVSRGDLTPVEAENVSKLLDRYARTLEHVEFEQRLAKLETDANAAAASAAQDGQNGDGSHDSGIGQDHQPRQSSALDPDSPYNFGDAP
jgi:hypothetical protein